MNKFALIFLFFILITNQVSAHNNMLAKDEMTQMADLTKEAGSEIDEWQVTIKETMTKERLLKHVSKLEDSYLASYSEDDNVIKYKFRSVQKTNLVYERYTVIIPKNDEFEAELISVISGTKWNEIIENRYTELQESIISQYFTENSIKFACLITKSSDTIKSGILVDFLKEKLKLQHVKTQDDNVEHSMNKKIITGYTHLWNQRFNILDKPMNVNIAITDTTNGKSKVTIGTPILIIEY